MAGVLAVRVDYNRISKWNRILLAGTVSIATLGRLFTRSTVYAAETSLKLLACRLAFCERNVTCFSAGFRFRCYVVSSGLAPLIDMHPGRSHGS